MSPRLRRISTSIASTTVVALGVSISVASPAAAEPCTGAAAAAQPPAPVPNMAVPSGDGADGLPLGHRPAGATDGAPLPRLGLLDALSPSAAVHQEAAVAQPARPAVPDAATRPADPAPPAAAPGTSLVGWVTGPDSPNDTIKRFAITGTDLGIMWDNGNAGARQVLMAFGDTYGYCGVHGKQWRYNVLFRSQDGALSKTVRVPDGVPSSDYSGSPVWASGLSKQVLNSIKWAPTEKGIIPTAGISVGGTQYMNFMSIRSWDSDGRWSTNFSGIAGSADNGENWSVFPGSVRAAGPGGVPNASYVPGNENFQQGAFLRPGDGYVYSFGTPSGRSGAVYASRVPQSAVPDLSKYEYWNGSTWVPREPGAAAAVIPGPVGEMSAQYNTYLKQFLVLYCNGRNDVVSRTAPAPQGPWGPEQLLVSSSEIPGGIYAPFLHPWSTGKELYFNLSLWSAYNVMLMRTVLP